MHAPLPFALCDFVCPLLLALGALSAACGPSCENGKRASGKYCCWPGQRWSDAREACVGPPKCPGMLQAHAGSCLGPTPACPEGMVGIGAASFHLGSNRSPEVRGAPRLYEVKLGAFCIDRTEVTVAAYKRCVDAGSCSAPYSGDPDDLSWVDKACNQLLADRLQHPVNCVDWKQAQAYCRWAGKRLPTEEEWALAAGRLDGRKFAWGDAPPGPDKANLRGGDGDPERPLYAGKDGWQFTAPVGSFPKDTSPFGLVDMGGNVSEWTSTVDSEWKWVFVSGGDYGRAMEVRERVLIAPHDSAPMSGIRCTTSSLP